MKKSLMHLTCCYNSYFALRHTMPYVLSVASVTLASDPPGTLRGRRGTFGTSIDVSGSLATKGDIFDAAAFCVAGVTL